MKKFVILILFVALVGYGGVKYYLYNQLKEFVANANTALTGNAKIEYGAITSDLLNKSVGLEKVNIQYTPTGDDFYIGEIDLIMPDYRSLLETENPKTLKEFPQSMTVDIKDMRVNLSSNVFDSMMTSSQAGSNKTKCAIDEQNWIAQLKRLGHSSITFDSTLGFNLLNDYEHLQINALLALHEIQTVNFSVTNHIGPSPAVSPLAVFVSPRLVDMSIEVYDDNLTKALIDECVTASGESKSIVIDKQIKTMNDEMIKKYNVKLNDDMVTEIRQYLDQPGHIKVNLAPFEPVELLAMSHYKAADVPALLNLTIENIQ